MKPRARECISHPWAEHVRAHLDMGNEMVDEEEDMAVGRCPALIWRNGITSATDPVMLLFCAALINLIVVWACRRRQARRRRIAEEKEDAREGQDSDGESRPLLPTRSDHAAWPPPAVDAAATTRKKRVAWLDHAKLLAMLMVNYNHLNETFSHSAALGPEAKPSTAFMAFTDTVGLANMPIFFFCSGVVARDEFSTAYLRAGVVQLLLPCFMMDSWNVFSTSPSYKWTSSKMQLGTGFDLVFYIGAGLWQNHVRIAWCQHMLAYRIDA